MTSQIRFCEANDGSAGQALRSMFAEGPCRCGYLPVAQTHKRARTDARTHACTHARIHTQNSHTARATIIEWFGLCSLNHNIHID